MVDRMFECCVAMLLAVAALSGTTYHGINVIIYCLLWPVATFLLFVLVMQQRRKIQELEKKCLNGVIK